MRRIQYPLTCFAILVLLAVILLLCGCVQNAEQGTGPATIPATIPPTQGVQSVTSGPQGLQIVLKDPGMPQIKYLQPNITEVQLQDKAGQWITIWSSPGGKKVKLTPDGTEVVLDTVMVPAGTYSGTRLKVSTIDVEVDINRDGDTLDENQQIVLTLEEFNKLPPREKPSRGSSSTVPTPGEKPTPPTQPTTPTRPPTPTKPGKIVGAMAEEQSKPSKPPEPTRPPEPAQPTEPAGPGGMLGGMEPSPPYKIVGDLVYMDVYLNETHTVTLNDYIAPLGEDAWTTDFVYDARGGGLVYDFTLHPLAIKGEQITVNVTFIAPPPEIPVELISLSISPDSVTGGTLSTGTVTMNLQAPAGGQVVQLSASPAGSLLLPANITIEAGATTGTFNIVTPVVTSTLNATIAAELGSSRQTAQLTIKPAAVPGLSALTVSPDSVVNGDTSTGTVTLDLPAPAGGQVVQLSANPGSSVRFPASVTVKAGETSGTFSITTYGGGAPVHVTITATLKGVQKTAFLTIRPTPAVSTLTLAPDAVVGGSPSAGTVTLNSAAPAGGQVVVLSTNSNLLTVPPRVAVKAGETTGSFTILTNSVVSPVTANIVATLGDSQKTAQLTINPAPAPAVSAFTLSPSSVLSGEYSVGRVTLSGPASSEGQVVVLSSNSTLLTVPPRVVVKAGETAGSFTILTGSVISPETATITATSGNSRKTAQLTINPVPAITVSDFTLLPESVLSGESSVGTVTLSGPAPSGGQIIQLSADSVYLTLPPSITIQAGGTSGTFNIQVNVVATPTQVPITALIGDSRKTASLTINPMPAFCPYTCRPATRISSGWSTSWETKCGSDEIAVQSSCPTVKQCYSCGSFGWSTCCEQVPSICCKPK